MFVEKKYTCDIHILNTFIFILRIHILISSSQLYWPRRQIVDFEFDLAILSLYLDLYMYMIMMTEAPGLHVFRLPVKKKK